jgi:hypothetical protein
VQYEETEHYQVAKMFLSFKERMLKELLTVETEDLGEPAEKQKVKRRKRKGEE